MATHSKSIDGSSVYNGMKLNSSYSISSDNISEESFSHYRNSYRSSYINFQGEWRLLDFVNEQNNSTWAFQVTWSEGEGSKQKRSFRNVRRLQVRYMDIACEVKSQGLHHNQHKILPDLPSDKCQWEEIQHILFSSDPFVHLFLLPAMTPNPLLHK